MSISKDEGIQRSVNTIFRMYAERVHNLGVDIGKFANALDAESGYGRTVSKLMEAKTLVEQAVIKMAEAEQEVHR